VVLDRSARAAIRERVSTRGARLGLGAIVLLAALVRLSHFVALQRSELPRIQLYTPGADTAAHWEWSDEILAGDWLGRRTFHQSAPWMERIAPMATWYRWWGNPAVFHREPFYPYFLAAVRALAGPLGARDSPVAAFGSQLLVGTLQPIVLFALGRRLLDTRSGLVAALVGAVYGPIIFFEGSLLRDWIPALLDPLLLLALLRAQERRHAGLWIAAGCLFGVSILVRSSILFFLPLCLVWIARETAPHYRRVAALLLVGMLMGCMPLIVRNLLVGVPAFSTSNRAIEAIIEANAVDAQPIGLNIPPTMAALLTEADGSLVRTVRGVLRQYDGQAGALLRRQWVKLWGLFDPREFPDNLDYAYGQAISPVLRGSPGFPGVALCGIAGLLLTFRQGGAHRLIRFYVVAALATQVVTIVVGRYRLALTAVLIAIGATYPVQCWDRLRVRSRSTIRAIGLVPALVAVYLLIRPAELRALDPTGRELEYSMAIRLLLEERRFPDALDEVRRFRDTSAATPDRANESDFLEGFVRSLWAEALQADQRSIEAHEQAVAARTAWTASPQGPFAWYRLGSIFFAIGDYGEARTWLTRHLAEDPNGPYADDARRLLGLARSEDAAGR
jgi:dolichyl-phosphate-mannose-protein mannosyltransferase